MTSSPLLKTLRRSWWILALFTLLGLATAQVVVSLSPTLYSSTDTLYISPTTKPGDTGTSAYEGNLLSQDRVKSYQELLSSGMIAGSVADRLGDGTTAAEIQAMTSVANQPETTLLTVTVTDTSPDRAAMIANAYGDVFGDVVRGLEKPQDPAALPPLQVRTAFPATPYPYPISPRPGVALPVGLLLGLVAGIGVAVLRRRVDDRVDAVGALGSVVDAPVLGAIRRSDGEAPAMLTDPLSGAAEDVRRVRGALRHAVPDGRPSVVLVAGAGPGEGRTSTAIELALALSDTGDRVLLLEADLRHPAVAARLGLPEERGLVSVLTWECSTAKAVQRHGPGFDVVVAGTASAADSERLSSSLLSTVIEELATPYDWVVVDSPPLTSAADAGILAPLTTGVVVLARHGRTSARTLRAAADDLRAVGATILGTVLVGVPAPATTWRERLQFGVPLAARRGGAEPEVARNEPAPAPVTAPPAVEEDLAATTTGELVPLRTANGGPHPPPDRSETSS